MYSAANPCFLALYKGYIQLFSSPVHPSIRCLAARFFFQIIRASSLSFVINHICVSPPGWRICQLLLLFWQGFLRSNAFFKVAFVLVRFFATLFLCVLLPQQWLWKYFLSPHWWWRKCLPFTISVDLSTSFSGHIFYQRQWKWWNARFKAQRL